MYFNFHILEDKSRVCCVFDKQQSVLYMVYSGLVDHGLRLQIPDVSSVSVADIFRGGRKPRPTSPEDTIYIDAGRESLNQNYLFC